MRGWTHLERQKGGIGLRGPGETQLETDRRLIGERVKLLRDRLAQVGSQRETQRRARRRAAVRNVALVGYTNAGKSTLFNRLTGAESYAADQLFATLDTTMRRLFIPGAETIVALRHGGLHPRPAARPGRRVPRHAQGSGRRRPAAARRSTPAIPAATQQIAAVDAVLAEIGADGSAADPGAEQVRSARASRPASSATNMVKFALFV